MCGDPVGSAIHHLILDFIQAGRADTAASTSGHSEIDVYMIATVWGSFVSLLDIQPGAVDGDAAPGSMSRTFALGSVPMTSIQSTWLALVVCAEETGWPPSA